MSCHWATNLSSQFPMSDTTFSLTVSIFPIPSGDRSEVFGQLVVGLGEVLVGNSPGNALTFTAKTGAGPVVTAYPSKPITLVPPSQRGIIARSDSNGEDLEVRTRPWISLMVLQHLSPWLLPYSWHLLTYNSSIVGHVWQLCKTSFHLQACVLPHCRSQEFAGAGLYDSIMSNESMEDSVDYTAYPLFYDGDALNGMTSRLAELGRSLESAMGGQPQDIEGVICGDQIYVVQSRPQIV